MVRWKDGGGESTVVLKVALFDHVMETGKIYM